MKLITQKHNTGCGVAAFAMVLNISYDRAMALLHPTRFWWFSKATTTVGQISEKLRALGRQNTISTERDFLESNRKAIIIIKATIKKKPNHHAVVWDPVSRCILNPSGNSDQSLEYYLDRFEAAIVLDN
jgi:hypothetical protein